MNRLAITCVPVREQEYIAYIVLDEKREFVDFQLFPPEEQSLMDHIYIGRVEKVVDNINAAFVRISDTQNCYLPLEELKSPCFTKKVSGKHPLCQGDELLVQITKDAVKTKDPIVSTKLSFHGRFCVLTTGNTALAVSKKLPEQERERLHTLLVQLCGDHTSQDYGIVLRTNSVSASEEELVSDILATREQYRKVVDTAVYRNVYSRMHQNPPAYINRIRSAALQIKDGIESHNQAVSIDRIYTDCPDIYRTISEYMPGLCEKKVLQLYDDKQVSLSVLYNIRGNIDRLLSEKVWLKSGANLVIERTEAMTVIDVNTAKNITAKENIACQVNREAAIEIARQLRLRNISGIILIDFINMESGEQEQELIALLRREIRKDPVPCRFIDLTGLGLVELTRKKVHRSLYEIVEKSDRT